MKILIGNGKTVKVYDISEPIYEVSGEYLPLHGHQIMTDEKAKKVITQLKQHGKGRRV